MKKILTFALTSVMVMSLMACQSDMAVQINETKDSVTITSLNAKKEAVELEVPYDPQRLAILDMASLDILDALGMGDRVVGVADTS